MRKLSKLLKMGSFSPKPLDRGPQDGIIRVMSQGTTTRTASRDILARCMATENINVEHRADAETAAFDVKNRVLILPMWKDMDNSVYDMLVGHEVSHALHTPNEGWQEWIGQGPDGHLRQQFLNVVEDARIERLIKAKFPGLRRDFASAYASLHGRDLFEIAGKDLSALQLLDRLNLHFKIGLFGLETLPFSENEQVYVDRMATTETFEEVCALAQDLYDLYQSEQEDEPAPEPGDEGMEGEGETQQVPGGGGDESDEDSDTESSTDDGDDGEDTGDSAEDDTDDGESAESRSAEDSNESGTGASDTAEPMPLVGETQRAFENAVSDLRDEDANESSYWDIPKPVLSQIVVDHPVIDSIWKGWETERNTSPMATHGQNVKTYLNSIRPIVNAMVQEFQRKQAAEAFKRTETAKTGILDTIKMTNYRWSEDIFVRNEVHHDGKSHGVVMVLDWSGSMHPILKDTIEQLLVLTEFCRKVNVPFEVYAFSSSRCQVNEPEDRWSEEWNKWHAANPQWNHTGDDNTRPRVNEFSLLNFLSSRMNKSQMSDALARLWSLASHDYCPPQFGLGATPLNEAIIAVADVVNQFQRETGVDIVNAVFLTDGEGSSITGFYGRRNAVLRDTTTKRNYAVKPRGYTADTDALLEWFKDQTGATTIGIRLLDCKNIKGLRYNFWANDDQGFETASNEYKKNNFCLVESNYDEYFIVKGDLKVQTDAMDALDDDASYTRLKNAFIKGSGSKKSSRVIATRIAGMIAA